MGTPNPGLLRLREQYDAILIDLDGTLLDAKGRLTERTAAAIQDLRAVDMRVLVCTGRSVAGTVEVHSALNLNEPVVAYNGSWIGIPGATPEQRIAIPPEAITPLAGIEDQAEFTFRCDGRHKYTVHSAHGDYAAVAKWYEDVRTVECHALPTDELMRISMYFQGTGVDAPEVMGTDLGGMLPIDGEGDSPFHGHWRALSDEIRTQLRCEWFPLRIFPPYRHSALEIVEVAGASTGKAEGVAYVERAYGIPPERVIAVGDQRNDLPMHHAAGLAIAMGNAVPEVAAIADLQIGHHAEDGLAAWIEAGAPLPSEPVR